VHEPLITVVGNVGQAPVLRAVAGGTPVASFRVAATPRKQDKTTEEWNDGETLWFGVSAWRRLGEHCASSLKVGDRVVITGLLTLRTWKSDDGKEHPGLQLEATNVGLDLSRVSAVSFKPPTRKGAEDEPAVDRVTGELLEGPTEDEEELEGPAEDGEELEAQSPATRAA